jgi:hypothetical protein
MKTEIFFSIPSLKGRETFVGTSSPYEIPIVDTVEGWR